MKKRSQLFFLNFLLVVLVAFGAIALYMSVKTQQDYEEGASSSDYDYDEIQNKVTLTSQPDEPEFSPPYDTEEMLSINPDFKGWLWIPDTEVNYPVVQTSDNNTYLRRSFQGQYSVFGSLFLDQVSVSGSRSRVIHGHNMGTNRSEMFSCLINYQNPDWAGERLYAYFTEPDTMEDCQYQLFAVLNFNIYNLSEFNYFQTDFETEEEFHSFVDYLKSKSLFETGFYPQRDLLILSTCNPSRGGSHIRLLVCFARIAPEPADRSN